MNMYATNADATMHANTTTALAMMATIITGLPRRALLLPPGVGARGACSDMDIFTLQKAMGHADLTVLRRYLAQTSEDVERAHRITGPVDNVDW